MQNCISKLNAFKGAGIVGVVEIDAEQIGALRLLDSVDEWSRQAGCSRGAYFCRNPNSYPNLSTSLMYLQYAVANDS